MAIPVIDGHHHIWRRSDIGWLNGPIEPRIFGDYSPICRDYPVAEFIDDAAPHGVVKSVYVQCNWPDGGAEDEAAYVSRAAEETGWPHGFVGYGDLLADDARPALDRLAAYPLTRGIRMQLHWHEETLYRYAARPDIADDPVFRRNFEHVAQLGWSFDLQIFDHQAETGARLARDFPGVTFILQHCGMPFDMSEQGHARWRAGMELLAAQPNVISKLSGLGTFIRRNDPEHIAKVCAETIALFGPQRCLFGSNFPIEKLWTAYGPLIDAYRAALAGFNEADRRAILHDTAEWVYRL